MNAQIRRDDARAGGVTENPPGRQAQNQDVLCGMCRDDIGDNVGALITTLHAALAMRDCGDDIGLIYSLRRAKAYWRVISENTRDLVELRAEAQAKTHFAGLPESPVATSSVKPGEGS